MDTNTLVLEAFVYRKLRDHLSSRSDAVQNMALMTISGFCRNCLWKWYYLGAMQLGMSDFTQEDAQRRVYNGLTAKEWKKTHQTKASPEELEAYESSASLRAHHVDPTDVCCQDPSLLSFLNEKVLSTKTPAATLNSFDELRGPPLRALVVTVSDRASRGEYVDESGPGLVSFLRSSP